MKILITGADGQLGKSLRARINNELYAVIFTDQDTLDITDPEKLKTIFTEHNFDYCINTAAYTNVDEAESKIDFAMAINSKGAEHLANACLAMDCVLIHISTDFVFDGEKRRAYTEKDDTNPINVYGRSKLAGEKRIREILKKHFIVRTSWLYSEFGKNFLKTMNRLAESAKDINVVDDQWGSPTYAGDLAEFIMMLISLDSKSYGTYHYSNDGRITWYEFARTVFEFQSTDVKVNPISTSEYKTPARRPKFSKLDTTLTTSTFGIPMKDWKESLRTCLRRSQISS